MSSPADEAFRSATAYIVHAFTPRPRPRPHCRSGDTLQARLRELVRGAGAQTQRERLAAVGGLLGAAGRLHAAEASLCAAARRWEAAELRVVNSVLRGSGIGIGQEGRDDQAAFLAGRGARVQGAVAGVAALRVARLWRVVGRGGGAAGAVVVVVTAEVEALFVLLGGEGGVGAVEGFRGVMGGDPCFFEAVRIAAGCVEGWVRPRVL